MFTKHDTLPVTIQEIKELTEMSKEYLAEDANSMDRDIKVYLHWSAGHYGQFFEDYHINIDEDGQIYLSTFNFAEQLPHTWRRNTGSIGISLACCAGATSTDLGEEPPTTEQIETMARVVAIICRELDIPIDKQHVLTHGEAADCEDGENIHPLYGPNNGCERWDLAILSNDDEWGTGGDTLRGKAIWYFNH